MNIYSDVSLNSARKPIHLLKIYLARQYIKLYSKDLFIGVAGSVGRSTCIRAANAILSQKFKTISTKVNSDSVLNIPETLLKITPEIKKVILEMGVRDIKDVDFYLSLIQPKMIIFTKIAYDNCENLGGLSEIIEEYTKLIRQLDSRGVAVLNFDDSSCKKIVKECKGEVIYFGTNPQNCNVWAGNIRIENFKTTFELNFGVERVQVNFPLLGTHNLCSALAAATLGVVNNIPLTKIKIALEALQPFDHQMQLVLGPNNSIILDDTYTSSPSEAEGAIDSLLQMSARRRIVVLGEMRNLGKYSESLHRSIAQKLFKEKIDLVFLGQGDSQFIASELKSLGFWEERIESNLQNSQLVSRLLKTLSKGDVVLIKGAHENRLDEVVKRIAKKS